MDYSVIASNLKNKIEIYRTVYNKVNTILSSMEDIWISPAGTVLKNKLSLVCDDAKKNILDLDRYCSVLIKTQEYVKLCEKCDTLDGTILDLKRRLSSLQQASSTTDGSNTTGIDYLRRQIYATDKEKNIAVSDKNRLKNEILNALGSFGTSTFKLLYSNSLSNFDMEQRLSEICAEYEKNWNPADKKFINSSADYEKITGISRAELEGQLELIRKNYTGEQAVLLSALAVLEPLASTGYRLNYKLYDPSNIYTSLTDIVDRGSCCNGFASFLVDKGAPKGCVWQTVDSFRDLGTPIDKNEWENIKCGDVMVSGKSRDGHVFVVLGNHPEADNPFVYIAEAQGPNYGTVMKAIPYSELNSYTAYDLSDLYSGEMVDTCPTYGRKSDFLSVYSYSSQYYDSETKMFNIENHPI